MKYDERPCSASALSYVEMQLVNERHLPSDVVQLIFAHLVTFTDYAVAVYNRFRFINHYMDARGVGRAMLWKPFYLQDRRFTGMVMPLETDLYGRPFMSVQSTIHPFGSFKVYGVFLRSEDFTPQEEACLTVALNAKTWEHRDPWTRSFHDSSNHMKALAGLAATLTCNKIDNVLRAFDDVSESPDFPYVELMIIGLLTSSSWERVPCDALSHPDIVPQVLKILTVLGDTEMLLRFTDWIERAVQLGVFSSVPRLSIEGPPQKRQRSS